MNEKLIEEVAAEVLRRQALHDGFVDKTAWTEQSVGVGALSPVQLTPTQSAGSRGKNGLSGGSR